MKKRIAFLIYVSIIFLVVTKGALACKGSQVLYEDNFATLNPAWGQQSANLSVNNGKLILQPNVNEGLVLLNQANLLGDMDACINVTMAKSDDPIQSAGLIFWAKDYGDYYYLLVNSDGWFSVNRWVNGNRSATVDWRENAAVKKGVGQINQLRVVTKGNQATVYINDMEAVTFKGQPPDGGGFIGVKGNSAEKSQIVWEFSDLKITKPEAPIPTAAPVASVTSGGCKGQVLYEDNFAAMDPSWGTPSADRNVSNGRFLIQPVANSSSTVLNQGNVFEDMNACINVTLAKSDDPNSGGGGLVFWAKDYNDFYYLEVFGNGFFQVVRWTSGRWLYPVSWRENAAIKKGIGQTNQLELMTKGNQTTVYVNSTEVITFKGQPPQGGSLIGLKGDSPEKSQAIWEFSDLKITKP